MGHQIVFPALTAIGSDNVVALEAVLTAVSWKEAKSLLHDGIQISEWKECWRNQNLHWDKYQEYLLCSSVIAESHQTCTAPGFIIINPRFDTTFKVKDPGLDWLANIEIAQGDRLIELIAKHHHQLHPTLPLRDQRQRMNSRCGIVLLVFVLFWVFFSRKLQPMGNSSQSFDLSTNTAIFGVLSQVVTSNF